MSVSICTINRSLDTLASTLAAAMQAAVASPPMTGRDGTGSPGTRKPSVRTYPGVRPRPATARRIPSMFATCTPMRSTSAASTNTTLHASANFLIRGKSSSRRRSVSFLESSRSARAVCDREPRMHAATVNGPAQAPLPASSTPATGPSPLRSSADSMVRSPAALLMMGRGGHDERLRDARARGAGRGRAVIDPECPASPGGRFAMAATRWPRPYLSRCPAERCR